MPRFFCLLLITLFSLTLSPSAHCQSTDFVPILAGDKHPLTLKLKDLDSTWRQMSVNKASAEVAPSIAVAQGVMLTQTFSAPDTYYTQGETVAVSGEIFLIAYHRIYTQDEIKRLKGVGQPIILPSPPDTALSLSLINLRQIASLDGIQAYAPQTAEETAQIQQKADDDASVSNLKQLGLAIDQYMQDYDEKLPPMQSAAATKTAIYPYVKNDATFEQPQTHALYQPNTSLSHRSLASFAEAELATIVIYYEPDPAPDGKRAVLFLDGHVRRVEEAEWKRLKAASHIPKPTAGVQ